MYSFTAKVLQGNLAVCFLKILNSSDLSKCVMMIQFLFVSISFSPSVRLSGNMIQRESL